MNIKRMSVVTLLVLMLSVCVFAAAEQTEPTEDPFYPGLIEEDVRTKEPTATPKPTRTPKPTATPKPTPTEYPFEPGLREDHEGHKIEHRILDSNDWRHTIKEYCSTCRMTIKDTYTEDHQLDADGRCIKCSYRCKHDSTLKYSVPADGAVKTWDGEWISYPGTEIEKCYRCGKVLKSENKIIKESHTRHLRSTVPEEWQPYDGKNHFADVICLDCGTTFKDYGYHLFNEENPYIDDGDPDTHTHQIVCKDCGFTAEQREPHHFVHDSYMKDESEGTDTGHIEVLKCDVCGAKKFEKQPHDAGTHVAFRANGDPENHTEILKCTLCGEQFEADRPHALEHDSYKHDDDTQTHIEVLKCAVCEQLVEERVAHKPMHLYWKSVSDTQDQETVICNLCGLEYQQAPAAHTFNSYAYVSEGIGSAYHTKFAACSKCGTQKSRGEREAHTWKWGGEQWGDYCTKCNEAGWHAHVTGGGRPEKGYRAVDENNHIRIWSCDYCSADYEWGIDAHNFDPVTMKCAQCGYLKEGCEHHYTYSPVSSEITKEKHTLIGTCTGCGKQITVTGTHDMQFVSATEFKPDGNGHARVVTERCSACGYENQPTESEGHNMQRVEILEYEPYDELRHFYTVSEQCSVCGYNGKATHMEGHTFDACESIGAQEHKLVCSKCGASVAEQHQFVCTDDETAHVCSVCGEKGEHDYAFAERRNIRSDEFHACVYQCKGCSHQIEENEKHTMEVIRKLQFIDTHHVVEIQCIFCDYQDRLWEEHTFDESGACACGTKKEDYDRHTLIISFEQFNVYMHNKIYQCTTCSYLIGHVELHVFDENGVCVCGYRKDDPISEAPLSGEGLTEGSGDGNAVMPVFCHLTADGKEMLYGYAFDPSEDGQTIDLILLPETVSGDAVIEIRFTAAELELLQALGVKSVYIRLSDTDILLLEDIAQFSGEQIFTLTPDDGNAYIVTVKPA